MTEMMQPSQKMLDAWSKELFKTSMSTSTMKLFSGSPPPLSTKREDYEALSIMGQNLSWGFALRGLKPANIVFKFKGSRAHAEREFCLWLVKQRLKE